MATSVWSGLETVMGALEAQRQTLSVMPLAVDKGASPAAILRAVAAALDEKMPPPMPSPVGRRTVGRPAKRPAPAPVEAQGKPAVPNPSAARFGCDIGGTLAKVVYLEVDGERSGFESQLHDLIMNSERYGETGKRETQFEFRCPSLGGRLHFISFSTARMHGALSLIKQATGKHAQDAHAQRSMTVGSTGGGSLKFWENFRDALGVEMQKFDELECLTTGIRFLLDNYPDESFSYVGFHFGQRMEKVPAPLAAHSSYMISNVGSGVSFLFVRAGESVRLGGTSIGGSTFFGLCCLFGCETFEEALEYAERGDNARADMLVSDIYGGDYSRHGLKGSLVASSFGKLSRRPHTATPADLARAALLMVTYNIGQLAYLHSRQCDSPAIIFTGSFFRNNLISKRTLSYSVDFWSKGQKTAVFLEHEGFLGCVGAFLGARGGA